MLLYFWLASPELALARVAERVAAGGHDIPEPDVRRRYRRSMANLTHNYLPLADVWAVYDNSSDALKLVAQGAPASGIAYINDKHTWQHIREADHDE